MAAAWQATIDQQLGIFAPDEEEVNPLMASDENVPEIKQPDVAVHRIWLKASGSFLLAQHWPILFSLIILCVDSKYA